MKIKINNAAGPQVHSQAKPIRLLPVMGILSFIAGLQVATQYFAYLYSYQPLLDSHIGLVYPPWGILQWAFKWYGRYPDDFIRAGSLGVSCSTIGFLIIALVKVVTANTSKAHQYLHGSARWASLKEIKTAGLLEGGVYVGGWMDKRGKFYYLRHDGPEHILTYAPTRSGKGVGLVIPTLLSWPSSCVITDLKGELWALTAGWRKQHAKNKVLLFEPAASEQGICWNPLDEIRINTDHEVGDVQNLANLIVDPDGKGLESHWQKTAFALLVGLILHALYKAINSDSSATLPSIDAMLADPTRDIGDLWTEMITYKHMGSRNHPAVGSAARDMMDRPEEEAGSVLSTAKSYLVLFRDPIVAENVSKSEFRIKDLMHHDDPVSLYIVTQPNDKARLRPLVRILVNMIVRLSADKLAFKDGLPVGQYKHRLLVMLDEFPSLGRLEILQESLAFVAGYGIKCYLICQDINQLKSRETGYGHDESISSNCHVQNAFPPNRIETAEHLSRLTGQTTVIKEQITTSGHRTAAMMGHVSRTIQEVQRALLTPDECLRMPGPRKNAKGEIEEAGDMVISVAGFPAIYGRQPLYFKDPVFKARAAIPAPVVSDKTVDRSHIGVIKL
jgi:type IV secretion system protein VirD4